MCLYHCGPCFKQLPHVHVSDCSIDGFHPQHLAFVIKLLACVSVVCVHVCLRVYLCFSVSVCSCVSAYPCMFVSVRVFAGVHVYVLLCVSRVIMHACMYFCAHMLLCTCVL